MGRIIREDTDTSEVRQPAEVPDPRLRCALPQCSQLVSNLHAQKRCEPPTPPPVWAAVCSTIPRLPALPPRSHNLPRRMKTETKPRLECWEDTDTQKGQPRGTAVVGAAGGDGTGHNKKIKTRGSTLQAPCHFRKMLRDTLDKNKTHLAPFFTRCFNAASKNTTSFL